MWAEKGERKGNEQRKLSKRGKRKGGKRGRKEGTKVLNLRWEPKGRRYGAKKGGEEVGVRKGSSI